MKARNLLAIGLLAIAGSVWVSAALSGGTSYTPPASGSGVSGDGTGITDPPAFRGNLGLGTAATVNTGTSAGTIPLLTTGGALPAVSGQNLTNIPGTAVTGLGTAAFGTLGTAANNVVQLNAGGGLPAVDGSNLTGVQASWGTSSWTYEWHASAGTRLLDSGWSQGTPGAPCAETMNTGYTSILCSAGMASSYLKYAPNTGATTAWEVRFKVRHVANSTTLPQYLWGYCPSAASGYLRCMLTQFAGSAPYPLSYFTGSSVTTFGLNNAMMAHGVVVNSGKFANVTVRTVTGVTNGTATTHQYDVYLGPTRVMTSGFSSLLPLATAATSGSLILGGYYSGGGNDLQVSDIYLKTDGLYPEHPSYTFRNEPY